MRFQQVSIFLFLFGFMSCISETKLVKSITVSSPSDSIITKGGTMQMVATIDPSDATLTTVLWAVNNTQGTATINRDGLLTAAADGPVMVRATAMDGTGVKGQKEILIKNQFKIDERDPLLWPFAANSIWNMPIGSNARYVPANLEMPTSAMLTLDEDLIILTPDEPTMKIYWCSVRWSEGDRCTPNQPLSLQANMPIPQSFVFSPTTWDGSKPNAGIAVLLKDKRTIWQSQPFAHCSNGSDATTGYVYGDNQDLYGPGYYGSHGGSRLSVIGGSIRNHELSPTSGPIRHAIKMNLCGKKNFYYDNVNYGFRWPALAADAMASTNYGKDRKTPSVPECRMGALMAIPATVTIASMNLETTPAKMLAQALQDYGGYVVDDTGWDVFAIETEFSPSGRFRDIFKQNWGYDFVVSMSQATTTPWGRDVVKIYKALNIIDNNSATSIGGGGVLRQEMAPPFMQ
ncbi:MAG: Ig-like domain-containing protein [Bacteroidia bacterium]|nr:Ig-like domain-containing protein [Bacteroidia bacterium]